MTEGGDAAGDSGAHGRRPVESEDAGGVFRKFLLSHIAPPLETTGGSSLSAPCPDCRAVETPRGGRCADCRRAQRSALVAARAWLHAYTAGDHWRLRRPAAAQDWRCLACGRLFGPELPPELALVLPADRGGEDVIGNRTALCRACLVDKGERTYDEWEAAGGLLCKDWRAVTTAMEVVQRLTVRSAPGAHALTL